MTIRGNLDAVMYDSEKGWVVSGWAIDTLDPHSPLEVEVLEGGQLAAAGRADEFRPDLLAAGISDGCHAFTLPLRSGCPAGDGTVALSLTAVAHNDLVICSAVLCARPFRGLIERVDGLVIIGWSCNATIADLPLVIEMLVDNEVVERLTADEFRADLAEIGLGRGNHGFRWPLPRPFVDGHPHRVSARIANTAFFLDGEIVDLVPRPAGITPEARRLFYLRESARQQLSGIDQALLIEASKSCTEPAP